MILKKVPDHGRKAAIKICQENFIPTTEENLLAAYIGFCPNLRPKKRCPCCGQSIPNQ